MLLQLARTKFGQLFFQRCFFPLLLLIAGAPLIEAAQGRLVTGDPSYAGIWVTRPIRRRPRR